MMAYKTKNYRIVGICPSFGILRTIKHNSSETESVYVLRLRVWTRTLLGRLERVNPSQLCFLVF
jgi:hypothetical protein